MADSPPPDANNAPRGSCNNTTTSNRNTKSTSDSDMFINCNSRVCFSKSDCMDNSTGDDTTLNGYIHHDEDTLYAAHTDACAASDSGSDTSIVGSDNKTASSPSVYSASASGQLGSNPDPVLDIGNANYVTAPNDRSECMADVHSCHNVYAERHTLANMENITTCDLLGLATISNGKADERRTILDCSDRSISPTHFNTKSATKVIDEDLCNDVARTCIKECTETQHPESVNLGIEYVVYQSEHQMQDIMRLITKDLSEPYSIYTYRYFIHNWPKLCFLAMSRDRCVGAIVCKLDMHKKMLRRGYIAMLAVDNDYRRLAIGSHLVMKAIRAMVTDECDEVVLETEITNKAALRLYENLGFVHDKRLFRYYLNGVDALRLKLWLR